MCIDDCVELEVIKWIINTQWNNLLKDKFYGTIFYIEYEIKF
jgi:hypothetical protein